MESYWAMLLKVKPRSVSDMRGGIEAQVLRNMLEKYVNFHTSSGHMKEMREPEDMVRQASANAFQLPKVLFPGDVFTNAEKIDGNVRDWGVHVVGFITYDDVCLFIFRHSIRRPLVVGLPYPTPRCDRPDWMQRALFDTERIQHDPELTLRPSDTTFAGNLVQL